MKPFEGIELVKVQSGKGRSGRAGSESCLPAGDRLEEKRRQRGSGPRGFSSEIYRIADAEVFESTEGYIV